MVLTVYASFIESANPLSFDVDVDVVERDAKVLRPLQLPRRRIFARLVKEGFYQH